MMSTRVSIFSVLSRINVHTYSRKFNNVFESQKSRPSSNKTALAKHRVYLPPPFHFSLHLVKSRFTGFAYVIPMLFRNEFNGF